MKLCSKAFIVTLIGVELLLDHIFVSQRCNWTELHVISSTLKKPKQRQPCNIAKSGSAVFLNQVPFICSRWNNNLVVLGII